MASFKETRDIILLSYYVGWVNDVLMYPSYISQILDLPPRCTLLEPPVIPLTKKINTYKKLDFSTSRVFVQCGKPENTKLFVLILKYIFNSKNQF